MNHYILCCYKSEYLKKILLNVNVERPLKRLMSFYWVACPALIVDSMESVMFQVVFSIYDKLSIIWLASHRVC